MKTITKFFQALSNVNDAIKECADLAWLDFFPATTTKLDEWFRQFGLKNSGSLTDAEKRAKLDGAWKATGSLSPRYLQDTLHNQGFTEVFVHEWWEPGTQPPPGTKVCTTPRNPLTYLQQGGATEFPGAECGEPDMECGEAFAECGNNRNTQGYPLQNIITSSVQGYITLCGEPAAECGESSMGCGNFTTLEEQVIEPVIPTDPTKWPYFIYIGGPTFPELAVLPDARRAEFEELLLKYCRASNWVGVLVTYT